MVTADGFLGLHADAHGDALRLGVERRLHGAFGGAFGGAVAACVVRAARAVAPGRRPASLDVRFLRPLPAGDAFIRASVVHAGKSLTTVTVDVVDAASRPAARGTVGLVAPEAMHPIDHLTATALPPVQGYDGGIDWRAPKGVEIPIVSTLRPRVVGSGGWGVATGLRVPWTDSGADAESACLGADMCVGPPVAAVCAGTSIPHPNPDLSLRFIGDVRGPELVAIGRVERIHGGLAAVKVDVWSDGSIVAIGVSSSMLLSVELPTAAGGADHSD